MFGKWPASVEEVYGFPALPMTKYIWGLNTDQQAHLPSDLNFILQSALLVLMLTLLSDKLLCPSDLVLIQKYEEANIHRKNMATFFSLNIFILDIISH